MNKKLLGVLVIASIVACGDDGNDCPDACDGLTIEVVDASGTVLTAFVGSAVVDGVGYEVECPGSTGVVACDAKGLLVSGTPDSVTVELEANSGFLSGSLQIDPVYQESFPNGAECGACATDSERLVLR